MWMRIKNKGGADRSFVLEKQWDRDLGYDTENRRKIGVISYYEL